MLRRDFLVGMGASALTAATTGNVDRPWPFRVSKAPNSLQGWLTKDGEVIVRVAVRFKETIPEDAHQLHRLVTLSGSGQILRGDTQDFHSPESNFSELEEPVRYGPGARELFVVTLFLEDCGSTSVLSYQDLFSFRVEELAVASKRYLIEDPQVIIEAELLHDSEIDRLNAADFGIDAAAQKFSVVAMADGQGGDPSIYDDSRTRMKIHNAFLTDTIDMVNRLTDTPAFNVMIGDIVDGWGVREDFLAMNEELARLQAPTLYTVGNHETDLRIRYGANNDLTAFDRFFAAQRAINGLGLLAYSMDVGDWHFVFWPDPLRNEFWERRTHYLDWLRRDLADADGRPTVVFQHVPIHPIGIGPMVSYCEAPSVKRRLLNVLKEAGNVRYVLSGHVHIPVRASIKTATTIEGIHFINLPAAGYRPRAFGEEDIVAGPCQGAAILQFDRRECEITFKTVTDEEIVYPSTTKELDMVHHHAWFFEKHELPRHDQVVNGDFLNGTDGWSSYGIYKEDENPSVQVLTSDQGLTLWNRKRRFDTPGQDRLPQAPVQLVQAIEAQSSLQFRYLVPSELCDFEALCGGFLWLEGFEGRVKRWNRAYAVGKHWYNFFDKHSDGRSEPFRLYSLDDEPDEWHQASIPTENCEHLVITFGVWTINQGQDAPFGWTINQVRASEEFGVAPPELDEAKVWWRNKYQPNVNIAGEHRYNLPNRPKLNMWPANDE